VPGRIRLSEELGVNHKTVGAALRILDAEGILESQGAGRERRIAGTVSTTQVALRVMILGYDKNNQRNSRILEIMHRLRTAGHVADFAPKTLRDLGMDPRRIARFVGKTEADAWVVVAGSREVLDWFSAQPVPAFALFGRNVHAKMASAAPRKAESMVELVDRLVSYGHRRIVILAHAERRKPSPGTLEQLILARLEYHGIRTGAYNLPDWDDEPDGLRRVLDSLFRHSPPTALIVEDEMIFLPVVQQLARMGIFAPDGISLACTDASPTFEWCRPPITHIAWNQTAVINRVVNWTNHISRGKPDQRMFVTQAKLVPGGTIGPVPGKA
jgi:DNA-binding LacI/PurR family transcriptional regulator/predicted transcriptional regulator